MQLQVSLPKELDNISMYLVRISIIYCNLSASKHYPDVPLLINFNQPFVVALVIFLLHDFLHSEQYNCIKTKATQCTDCDTHPHCKVTEETELTAEACVVDVGY